MRFDRSRVLEQGNQPPPHMGAVEHARGAQVSYDEATCTFSAWSYSPTGCELCTAAMMETQISGLHNTVLYRIACAVCNMKAATARAVGRVQWLVSAACTEGLQTTSYRQKVGVTCVIGASNTKLDTISAVECSTSQATLLVVAAWSHSAAGQHPRTGARNHNPVRTGAADRSLRLWQVEGLPNVSAQAVAALAVAVH